MTRDGAAGDGTVVRRFRPAQLTWGNLGLVAAGGALGTGSRYALTLVVPPAAGVPVVIAGINVVGAFLLGALLEALAELRPDSLRSRRLRLGLGTGLLGGFTTYSTLAADNVALAQLHPPVALAYGVGSVVFGAVAAAAGVGLARRRLRPVLAARRSAP